MVLDPFIERKGFLSLVLVRSWAPALRLSVAVELVVEVCIVLGLESVGFVLGEIASEDGYIVGMGIVLAALGHKVLRFNYGLKTFELWIGGVVNLRSCFGPATVHSRLPSKDYNIKPVRFFQFANPEEYLGSFYIIKAFEDGSGVVSLKRALAI